ncbi:MAG: hypothetical protein ACRDTM_13830 [Micromonosporaceae bacterium]
MPTTHRNRPVYGLELSDRVGPDRADLIAGASRTPRRCRTDS